MFGFNREANMNKGLDLSRAITPHCLLENVIRQPDGWFLIYLHNMRAGNSPTESPLQLDYWPKPWGLGSRTSRTWRHPDRCRWWRAARCTWRRTNTLLCTFSNKTDERRHSWHITRPFVPIKADTHKPSDHLSYCSCHGDQEQLHSIPLTHPRTQFLPPLLSWFLPSPSQERNFTLTSSPCLGKHNNTFISSWQFEGGGQVSMVTVIWQFKPAIITSASKLASLSFYLAA